VRLRRLGEEFGDRLCVEWKSFLLRPRPHRRTLEEFRAYTQSWLRPAAEPDGGVFRVWQGDAGPPSHSVPPHLAAKAAARLGERAFDGLHARLMHAYFADNRDITDRATLQAIWGEAGLPGSGFADVDDPALLRRVVEEHNEATELGVTGVPAARAVDSEAAVIGAQPIAVYRRWIRRLLGEEN
jgi:predicted DsbA family dithiol-disulfide isomerase